MRSNLFGLIVCGGSSTRMGEDKSLLVYHNIPQRYYLYKMLAPICGKVFISCNQQQSQGIATGYAVIEDAPQFSNSGPMGAVLSAFEQFPGNDLLVIGCDYPHLLQDDIRAFLHSLHENKMLAAFYNTASACYEPLLAFYDHRCAPALLNHYTRNEHSLRRFLEKEEALKFFPAREEVMQSVDTKEAFTNAKKIIQTGNKI